MIFIQVTTSTFLYLFKLNDVASNERKSEGDL